MRKAVYSMILVLALMTAYAVSQSSGGMSPQGPTPPTATPPDASQRTPDASTPPATDSSQQMPQTEAKKEAKVDADALKTKVKDQLGTDPAFANIEVSAKDNGEVKLKGKVASDEDRKRAVQAAEAIPGVTKVKDKLKVEASSASAASPSSTSASAGATTPSASGETASSGSASTTSGASSDQSSSASGSSMPQSGSTSSTAPASGSSTGSVAGSTSSTPESTPSTSSSAGAAPQSTAPSSSTPPAATSPSAGTSAGTSTGSTSSTTPSTGVGSTGSTSSSGTTAGGTASTGTESSGSALPQSSGLPQSDTGASASADSSSLQTQIDAALKKEPTLANSNVIVNVTDSTVALSGSVATGKEKQTAKRIAQSFAGNRKVEDRITVSGQGSSNVSPSSTTQPDQTTPKH